MKFLTLGFVIVVAAAGAARPSAQEKPNLSGAWILVGVCEASAGSPGILSSRKSIRIEISSVLSSSRSGPSSALLARSRAGANDGQC